MKSEAEETQEHRIKPGDVHCNCVWLDVDQELCREYIALVALKTVEGV